MSSRPPVFTWNEEIHFGPASEPVAIQTFFNKAQNLSSRGLWPVFDSGSADDADSLPGKAITAWREWQGLPENARASIQEDCNLEDMKSSLLMTLNSQKHVSYLQKVHESAPANVLGIPPPGKNKRKGETGKLRKAAVEDDPELEPFREDVEQTPLKIWKLKSAARPYVRPGRISDQNALDCLKPTDLTPIDTAPSLHEALITLTAYTRNSWYPYAFSRESQCVLRSNNTLADIWSCVPCSLKGDGGMPKETIEIDRQQDAPGHYSGPSRERVVGYSAGDPESDRDLVVLVIEGIAYSDGRGSPDYADKLLAHIDAVKPPSPDADAPLLPPAPYERSASSTPLKKGLPIDMVSLRSLTLRVNEPYWILHRGSCEHWFVVDEIRLQNPRDPTSGYPIGLQRTPIARPLCRVCSKVPATLSVINDVRLGESPGMLCEKCWNLLGGCSLPKEGDDLESQVVVVPMVFKT